MLTYCVITWLNHSQEISTWARLGHCRVKWYSKWNGEKAKQRLPMRNPFKRFIHDLDLLSLFSDPLKKTLGRRVNKKKLDPRIPLLAKNESHWGKWGSDIWVTILLWNVLVRLMVLTCLMIRCLVKEHWVCLISLI